MEEPYTEMVAHHRPNTKDLFVAKKGIALLDFNACNIENDSIKKRALINAFTVNKVVVNKTWKWLG